MIFTPNLIVGAVLLRQTIGVHVSLSDNQVAGSSLSGAELWRIPHTGCVTAQSPRSEIETAMRTPTEQLTLFINGQKMNPGDVVYDVNTVVAIEQSLACGEAAAAHRRYRRAAPRPSALAAHG